MGCYLAVKRNEVTPAVTRRRPEDKLGGRSPTQGGPRVVEIHLYKVSRADTSVETRNGCLGLGVGVWGNAE